MTRYLLKHTYIANEKNRDFDAGFTCLLWRGVRGEIITNAADLYVVAGSDLSYEIMNKGYSSRSSAQRGKLRSEENIRNTRYRPYDAWDVTVEVVAVYFD